MVRIQVGVPFKQALVAQLDRVIRCQRIGCGIVPHQPLQKIKKGFMAEQVDAKDLKSFD